MALLVDLIIEALASLGGKAHLSDITARVRELADTSLPSSVEANIRARIQERSSDSLVFQGKEDLFYSVYGVNERRGWWGLRNDPLSVGNADSIQDGADAFIEEPEGRAILHIHLRRERSKKLIREFKKSLKNYRCTVCDFDFGATYGVIGHGYIEAHHIIPVADLQEGSKTRLTDLVPVCSNCHRMLHRNDLMDWRELKRRIATKKEAAE